MHLVEFKGINSFLVGMSKILLNDSVYRETRGQKVWELPEPIIIKISNPLSRLVTIPERKWNCYLPYAESLWLASGQNDMKMIGYYLDKLYNFSDDGKYMRAGYGPRLRSYSGNSIDYKKNVKNENNAFEYSEIDQFQFVLLKFKEDPFTRQAVISIGDPSKDNFQNINILKITKDFPCTRLIHFIRKADKPKLDLYVHLRSNDFLWGASAVNIFNYTFMQEYFSKLLNLEVGEYFHIVNNMHFYDTKKEVLEKLITVNKCEDEFYKYNLNFTTLEEFDANVKTLRDWEVLLRSQINCELIEFNDDFFNDWALVLFKKSNPKEKVNFINPILNQILGN
jgi:thymidylate synthase